MKAWVLVKGEPRPACAKSLPVAAGTGGFPYPKWETSFADLVASLKSSSSIPFEERAVRLVCVFGGEPCAIDAVVEGISREDHSGKSWFVEFRTEEDEVGHAYLETVD